MTIEGILPVDKPSKKTSFSLISELRKITRVQKIGHTGTLDPFASGVVVVLIGKKFTRLSDELLNKDKTYLATLHLGITTDSYDIDGATIEHSSNIPTLAMIQETLLQFQGTLLQTPPMFSAKKVKGKKLYELARQGITIERQAVPVHINTVFISYEYPYLTLRIRCSKGTYIRSLAHDIGIHLGCGAHLSTLTREQNGAYTLFDCCDGTRLSDPSYDWKAHLRDKIQ